MADPVAIWGAVTGTIGAFIGIRREVITGRRRLEIGVGVDFDVPRGEPPWPTTQGWAYVACRNTGGRPVMVERVGLTWWHSGRRAGHISVQPALELAVDSPSHRIYTPLGPLLAAGLTLTDSVYATAAIAGGRELRGEPGLLAEHLPPGLALRDLTECLERLERASQQPLPLDESTYDATYDLEREEVPSVRAAPERWLFDADRSKPERYDIRRERLTRAELVKLGWSDEDLRSIRWPDVLRAYAIDADDREREVIHHVRHSETGFSIGYSGQGPLELARCLLIDWFDAHDTADADHEALPVSSSRFMKQFLVPLHQHQRRVTITGADIAAWVRTELTEHES